MKKINKAFTLVELIVVITILAILGTIAFISLQGYSKSARDSRRISDVNNIKTSLELFILNAGKYPLPDDGEEISYSGGLLRTQGIVGDIVSRNLSKNLPKKPLDPLFETEYTYSVSNTQKEFELLGFFEGTTAYNINTANAASNYTPKISGTYNGVFLKTSGYIVPTPSIITSGELPLVIDAQTIQSQVISGGENFPNINNQTSTGKLDIILSPAPIITSTSTEADKLIAINAIQSAYSGTTLANNYEYLLSKTSNEDKLALVETVILNNNVKVTQADEEVVLIKNDDFTKLLIHSDIDYTNFNINGDFTGIDNSLPKLGKIWGTPIINIQNNKCYISNSGGVNGGYYTNYKLEGDFDIQVDFDLLTFPNSNRWDFALHISVEDSSYLSMRITNSSSREYRVSGNITGTRTNPFAQSFTSDTDGKLRITRIGNIFDTYYWDDNITDWVKLTNSIVGPTTPSLIQLTSASGNNNPVAEINFDNLQINSGNIIKFKEFEDDSLLSNNISTFGDTYNSTTEKKFGNTSMYFDGDGDYLSIPDSNDWDFGSEPYTIDYWINFNEWNTHPGWFSIGNNEWYIFVNTDNDDFIWGTNGQAEEIRIVDWRQTASLDTWYHISHVGDGTNIKLYIDGNLVGIATQANFTKGNLVIGRRMSEVDDNYFDGYIDEFHISKGIARWTENFTPPIAPYGN